MTRKNKQLSMIAGGLFIGALAFLNLDDREVWLSERPPGPQIMEDEIVTRPSLRYRNSDGSFNHAKFSRENGDLLNVTTNFSTSGR